MHIAYGHRTDDTRIFKKECISLANCGYDVLYVTSDKTSKQTEDSFNVRRLIVPLRSKNRLLRVILYMRDIKKIIKKEHPDVCHIHDIQIIFLLLIIPKRIFRIFDSHEDYPAYIADTSFSKQNFNRAYWIIEVIEKTVFKRCDHIITATPYIRKQIECFFSKVTDVSNYPIVGIYESEKKKKYKGHQICFTGGAGESSGITNVAKAIQNTRYNLVIAGNCPEDYLAELKSIAGSNIRYLGYLDKSRVETLIEESLVGIVTYLPTADCLHALPNKMFEYMERGCPIIYSCFPDWKDMLEKYNVGIMVDPNNPNEIVEAIDRICSDTLIRKEFSENARNTIEKVYNWSNEEKKLIEVYSRIKC